MVCTVEELVAHSDGYQTSRADGNKRKVLGGDIIQGNLLYLTRHTPT